MWHRDSDHIDNISIGIGGRIMEFTGVGEIHHDGQWVASVLYWIEETTHYSTQALLKRVQSSSSASGHIEVLSGTVEPGEVYQLHFDGNREVACFPYRDDPLTPGRYEITIDGSMRK
jgi:hypothetical protein